MMNSHLRLGLAIGLAILYTALFLDQNLGLNLLIFNILVQAICWALMRHVERPALFYFTSAGSIISAIAFVYNGSSWAGFLHITATFSLAGTIAYPLSSSVISSMRVGLSNVFFGPIVLASNATKGLGSAPRFAHLSNRSVRIILPLLVIAVFTWIYSASNTLFENGVQRAGVFISDSFNMLSELIEPRTLIIFLSGLVIASVFLFGGIRKKLRVKEESRNENLARTRRTGIHRFTGHSLSLRYEYKAALFLMVTLNLLILILNVLDIKLLWVGFEWNGELLKPMLHQGTYLLIFSILISMAVLLYYFRANLNFLKDNKHLKVLSYIWIAQNAFLCFSVLVRTYHYVAHFNLAYRRIGVVIFAMLCLAGLYFVYRKISDQRSMHYLVKRMSLVTFLTLILTSIPDWDRIIARYNFAHSDTAFVHLDYLSNLSNGALEILDLPLDELIALRQNQETHFESSSLSLRSNYYMTPEKFRTAIDSRIVELQREYPEQSWLEWNYADHRAYLALKDRNVPTPLYR